MPIRGTLLCLKTDTLFGLATSQRRSPMAEQDLTLVWSVRSDQAVL